MISSGDRREDEHCECSDGGETDPVGHGPVPVAPGSAVGPGDGPHGHLITRATPVMDALPSVSRKRQNALHSAVVRRDTSACWSRVPT